MNWSCSTETARRAHEVVSADRETVLDLKARALMLDVAVDLYGGNEIVRTEVRAMFRGLGVLARKMNGAAVMSMHVSQSGIKTEGGHIGITDWSNAARAQTLSQSAERRGWRIHGPRPSRADQKEGRPPRRWGTR